jgi:hypothetical protein
MGFAMVGLSAGYGLARLIIHLDRRPQKLKDPDRWVGCPWPMCQTPLPRTGNPSETFNLYQGGLRTSVEQCPACGKKISWNRSEKIFERAEPYTFEGERKP